jgi:hypothetical protein
MATKPNKNIKVSQATIDKIKKQGMTASLKSASSNNSPEYREALRRMYGDARVTKATAVTKKSASGGQPSGYRNPSQAGPANKPSNPRQADNAVAKAPVKKATASKPKTQEQIKQDNYRYQAGKPTPKPKKTPKTQEQIRQDNYRYQAGQSKPKPKTKPKTQEQIKIDNYKYQAGQR